MRQKLWAQHLRDCRPAATFQCTICESCTCTVLYTCARPLFLVPCRFLLCKVALKKGVVLGRRQVSQRELGEVSSLVLVTAARLVWIECMCQTGCAGPGLWGASRLVIPCTLP